MQSFYPDSNLVFLQSIIKLCPVVLRITSILCLRRSFVAFLLLVLHISGYTLFDFMYFNPINISERFFTSARVGDAIMLTSPFLSSVSPHVFGVPLSRRPYLVG